MLMLLLLLFRMLVRLWTGWTGVRLFYMSPSNSRPASRGVFSSFSSSSSSSSSSTVNCFLICQSFRHARLRSVSSSSPGWLDPFLAEAKQQHLHPLPPVAVLVLGSSGVVVEGVGGGSHRSTDCSFMTKRGT